MVKSAEHRYLPSAYVPNLVIYKQGPEYRNVRHAAVEVAQHRYYFRWKPCDAGSQAAFLPAVRDDGTHWALVVRRLRAKATPASSSADPPPRVPEPVPHETLQRLAAEVEMLQGIQGIPFCDKPVAFFTNFSGSKGYVVAPLGGHTLDYFLRNRLPVWMFGEMLYSTTVQLLLRDPGRSNTAALEADARYQGERARSMQRVFGANAAPAATDPRWAHFMYLLGGEHQVILTDAEKLQCRLKTLRVIASQLMAEIYAAVMPLHCEGFAVHDIKPENMVRRLAPAHAHRLGGPHNVEVLTYFMPIDHANVARTGQDYLGHDQLLSNHGTAPFESPEQIREVPTGMASDLWTVGAILFNEMITPGVGTVGGVAHVGLPNPFDVAVDGLTEQQWQTQRSYVVEQYANWLSPDPWNTGEPTFYPQFDAAFERLRQIDPVQQGAARLTLEDVIRRLMEPRLHIREQSSLDSTIGDWLRSHPEDVQAANDLFGPLVEPTPKLPSEVERALSSSSNARAALDDIIYHGGTCP